MHSTFPINTPLGLGDLLDLTFRLYRTHLGKLVLACAILSVPFGLLNILLLGESQAASFLLLRQMLEGGDPTVTPVTQTPTWLPTVNILLGFLINGMQTLAVTALGIEALHGNPLSISAGYKQAGNSLLRWVGSVLLMGLLMMGLLIVVGIIWTIGLALFGVFFAGMIGVLDGFDPAVNEGTTAIFIGLGILFALLYIALIIAFATPFVYVYSRWSLFIPCLVEENLGPSRALGRSWALTKNNVWRAIGYTILTSLISLTFVSLPVLAIQGALFWLIPAGQLWLTVSLSTALNTIATIALSPVTMLAGVLLYYELRVRKESYDLALLIERGEAK